MDCYTKGLVSYKRTCQARLSLSNSVNIYKLKLCHFNTLIIVDMIPLSFDFDKHAL